MIVICFISFSSCDFSEIVNIDEIINNATQIPDMDDQLVSGNREKIKYAVG